jgi:hypothetical protein
MTQNFTSNYARPVLCVVCSYRVTNWIAILAPVPTCDRLASRAKPSPPTGLAVQQTERRPLAASPFPRRVKSPCEMMPINLPDALTTGRPLMWRCNCSRKLGTAAP